MCFWNSHILAALIGLSSRRGKAVYHLRTARRKPTEMDCRDGFSGTNEGERNTFSDAGRADMSQQFLLSRIVQGMQLEHGEELRTLERQRHGRSYDVAITIDFEEPDAETFEQWSCAEHARRVRQIDERSRRFPQKAASEGIKEGILLRLHFDDCNVLLPECNHVGNLVRHWDQVGDRNHKAQTRSGDGSDKSLTPKGLTVWRALSSSDATPRA